MRIAHSYTRNPSPGSSACQVYSGTPFILLCWQVHCAIGNEWTDDGEMYAKAGEYTREQGIPWQGKGNCENNLSPLAGVVSKRRTRVHIPSHSPSVQYNKSTRWNPLPFSSSFSSLNSTDTHLTLIYLAWLGGWTVGGPHSETLTESIVIFCQTDRQTGWAHSRVLRDANNQ